MDGILGTQIILAACFAALAILAVVDGAWAGNVRRQPAFGGAWQPMTDDDAPDGA